MAKIFEVGGCVRDEILGINSKDIDFSYVSNNMDQTVEEGFNEMINYLTSNGFSLFLVTPECFTVRAKFPKSHTYAGMVADFVMARKEIGYYEGTRRPILEMGTLFDDLVRRDFTMNAIAKDPDTGELIDPFNGMDDITKGLIKTPIDTIKTMEDDPLRFLRAIRFSVTKGFTVSESIFEAVKNSSTFFDLFKKTVSKERIREEILKMMQFDTVTAMKVLIKTDDIIPGFLNFCFTESGMWFKPTFEK